MKNSQKLDKFETRALLFHIIEVKLYIKLKFHISNFIFDLSIFAVSTIIFFNHMYNFI